MMSVSKSVSNIYTTPNGV